MGANIPGTDKHGNGYSVDPEAIDLTLSRLGDAERQLSELINNIRNYVIIPGYENWQDPLGDKLLGTIDKITNRLDDTLARLKANDVVLRKSANILLQGTESTYQYPEVATIDISGPASN